MKQTAVEWLVKELEMNILWSDKARKAVHKAKEMDKQQIILSHINGQSEFDKGAISENTKKLATEYYNQTFKQK
jgi:hypothetical protein